MRRFGMLVIATVAAAVLLSAMAPAHAETRADKLGWQKESFDENVNLTYSPKTPTPAEPVVIRIVSRDPRVSIQLAYCYATVQTPTSAPVTIGPMFSRVNETVMTSTLSAYPNGTVVRFYVGAWDRYNVLAQSGNYSYKVFGQDKPGGWLHSQFDRNLNLTWRPALPNASEPARVTIRSMAGVEIYGANLYVIYEANPGHLESGGYPFTKVNTTAMWCDIPGYPMGTKVSFTVTAWDKYSNLTKSRQYDYTVPQEEDYASHPFVPFDGLSAVLGLIAFSAIGAFAFLRVVETERRRRKKGTEYGQVELLKVKGDASGSAGGAAGTSKAAKPVEGAPGGKRAAAAPTKEPAKQEAPAKNEGAKGKSLFGRSAREEAKE